MEILGIAMLAAGLMGAWHVTKYAVPRTARAMGRKRRAGIDAWTAAHPGAPAVARWPAALGKTVSTLRWGPRFLADETKKAWREGLEHGTRKYGIVPPEPDLYDPNDTKNCPTCGGAVVIAGKVCPACLARQAERNRQWDADHPPARPPGTRPRPHLVAVPDPIPTLIGKPADNTKENTMTIQTATGGEIVNAEQFLAEAKAIVSEASAELEDASGDSARAQEDFARIENMVGALRKQQALSSDIGAVQALTEPAQARAQAAKDRQVAAEQRLAAAKAVEVIAAKHYQLIGTAAGPFYQAA